MSDKKTKAIRTIEAKMEGLSGSSIRYQVLESARNFKESWIALGKVLYTVWKDKMYKEWGYVEFDAYTTKEIGVRKQTALKLLRSYSFLEREEPKYLEKNNNDQAGALAVPAYESVDLLRQAKNKDINTEEYANIRKYVLEDGKDAREVKKDLTRIIKQREELQPEEEQHQRRMTVIKRVLSSLRSLQKEVRATRALPPEVMKDTESLIERIEEEFAGRQ